MDRTRNSNVRPTRRPSRFCTACGYYFSTPNTVYCSVCTSAGAGSSRRSGISYTCAQYSVQPRQPATRVGVTNPSQRTQPDFTRPTERLPSIRDVPVLRRALNNNVSTPHSRSQLDHSRQGHTQRDHSQQGHNQQGYSQRGYSQRSHSQQGPSRSDLELLRAQPASTRAGIERYQQRLREPNDPSYVESHRSRDRSKKDPDPSGDRDGYNEYFYDQAKYDNDEYGQWRPPI